MGQGQEKRADETIVRMSEVGGWVFLQNVHLMQTWLPTLDEKLETVSWNKSRLEIKYILHLKYFYVRNFLTDFNFSAESSQKLPSVHLRGASAAALHEEHPRGPAAVLHLCGQ